MQRLIQATTVLILILLAFVSALAQGGSTPSVRLARAFPPHTKRIVEILFSPDGSRIAARSTDRTLRITDSKTGEAQVTITSLARYESLRQWSPDGQYLVTTDGTTNLVQHWDAKSRKRIANYGPYHGYFRVLHWKHDGRTPDKMLTESNDGGGIELWDLESNSVIGELRQRELEPNETRSFWKSIFTTKEFAGAVWTSATFADKGERVVTSNSDRAPQLWDADTGKLIAKLHLPDEIPNPGQFGQFQTIDPLPLLSPDTRLIAVRSLVGIRLWDAPTGRLIHTLSESDECVFSHDGKTIITTWRGKPRSFSDKLPGEVKIWDVASGQLQFKIDRAFKSVWKLNLAPDQKRLHVFGIFNDKMRLIDLEQRKILAELPVSGCVYDNWFGSGGCEPAAFSPGDKILMTQSAGDIKLWDARTGKLIVFLNDANSPVAFSPDGRHFITSSKDHKSVLLWEINDQ